MNKISVFAVIGCLTVVTLTFPHCTQNNNSQKAGGNLSDTSVDTKSYGGFESPAKWGEHLVTIAGCNDCHTPKKMTAMGPVNDSSLLLSGHPANMPAPDVDRKEMESKGIFASQTLTSWAGPWGISYADNLTSDSTGIGMWTEDQFFLCLRKGKWKGLETSRQLLPPMPWPGLALMSDDELRAIFAYLKSTKPIKNVVPVAAPPVLMSKK